jgi:hypothetical protein
MIRTYLLKPLCLIFLVFFSSSSFAHKPSDSYLNFKVQDNKVSGQWDIALRDLEFAVGLDANGDGDITWKEVKNKQLDISAYAFARLQLFADTKPCRITPQDLLIDHHSDGSYAVLTFSTDCVVKQDLDVRYTLFFDFDTQHKGLIRIEQGNKVSTGIFAAQDNKISFNLVNQSFFRQFFNYVKEGTWHIWNGFDHVLFLISLLLPAVFVIRNNRYVPVPSFKPSLVHTLGIVTSFTIAHSITLSLAALQIVVLPSRLVESTIAFSVIFAAFNNLWPFVQSRIWLVAFLFGLIHGFGFASVLMDLGLKETNLVTCLLGFNFGVEVGQFIIVLCVLPLIYFLRNTRFYQQLFFKLASAMICFVAFIWLIERLFDWRIITVR